MKVIILIWVAVFTIIYLSTSYIYLTFDFAQWGENVRIGNIVWGLFASIGLTAFFMNHNKNNIS